MISSRQERIKILLCRMFARHIAGKPTVDLVRWERWLNECEKMR